MMGLGSIVGTGIFVSIGNAAGAAGSAVVLAIPLAAIVAACNGLSSAQLAAAHPVSGGAYEYGYRWLHPSLGFLAGWLFLWAKTASAATAALGFAGYALNALGQDDPSWRIPIALAAIAALTAIVVCGIRQSSLFNGIVVSMTLLALLVFVAAGAPTAARLAPEHLAWPFSHSASDGGSTIAGFLEACALMFVAYTGYGRIATLGEEIRDPRRNIPRAIVITLLASMLLYVAVGGVAVASVGPEALAEATDKKAAPLEFVAERFDFQAAAPIVAVGAVTSMIGVLLNLLLGLSRVVLAMGRRRDLPAALGRLHGQRAAPVAAILGVGATIAGLVLVGDVKTTWSFSAFTVLMYYALTNLSALRMTKSERRYPRVISWLGLFSCLFLAFWVEAKIWLFGLGLIAAGFVWWLVATRHVRIEPGELNDTSKSH
jgi:APA family basic amino acid/polyamine antiporter